MIILQTSHPTNIKITNHFATCCKGEKTKIEDYIFNKNDTIASYGILRGTGEIFKNSQNTSHHHHFISYTKMLIAWYTTSNNIHT